MTYNKQMKKDSHFSIRQVIDLTGVSEFTIRGWENRYQAIVPDRTDKGRRIYSKEDLLKIKALKDLVDRGNQISSIAHLDLDELQKLLIEDQLEISKDTNHPAVNSIIKHSDVFAWDKVQKVFHDQRKKHSGKDLIFEFLLPLIKEINSLVEQNIFSIAREHILSAMIKEELYCLKNSHIQKKSKSRFVFATPENELHEMGILIGSTLANIHQLSNLYLGPNTPRQQIADVCLRFEATHLVISSTDIGNTENFLHFVHFLDKQLPKNITFCIGGLIITNLAINLKRELQLFWTIEEVDSYLKSLK